MCEAIEHRGPDARGVFVGGEVGLGVQRLRVIDLETGDQPIFNEDRSIAVVLNGEIYNFRELRERLVAAGHQFRSRSDTEVIVHLYEDEGARCVRSLHGMFAFALWDRRKHQLLLGRDRVGKKPLFYAHLDEGLSFASELGGLLQDATVPRDLDHQALDCYYAYHYVPAPLCAFRAIRKLPPASTLIYRNGRVELDRYWRLGYAPKRRAENRHELQEELRGAIDAAVRRRMISDVPLGAFLSGGIDSSAVVAAMARHSSEPVKTFSIGFADAGFNELPYARAVAELFSTDHHELVVEPSAIEILPKLVRHYGEPFADASALATFYLAELASRQVTVALNGDGGDESFAGYQRYVSNALAGRLGRLPSSLRVALGAVARHIPPSPRPTSAQSRVRRLGGALALTPAERYARYMSYFARQDLEELYTPAYREAIGESLVPATIAEPWSNATGSSVVDVMLETDVATYLPGDLLVKMDIATMAHSLEARSPLLDHELMEFAASLPAELKLRGFEKKVILRDALRDWLPPEVLDRPKAGLEVPISKWLRHELHDYTRDVLLDTQTVGRGYFRRGYVERMLANHASGQADNSARLWALLISELWHREYVDVPGIATPPTA